MAVEVGGGSTATFGSPTLLFRPPADIVAAIGPGNASVSRDGERFVIAVPRPQLRQLTMFDRQGKVVSTIGQPGFYNQPNLSPDGTRAVVMRNDPQTGNVDIWTIDLASGKGTPITNDVFPQNAPIWSPDGKQVAYVSTKDGFSGIYRKAADGTGEPELLFQYTPGGAGEELQPASASSVSPAITIDRTSLSAAPTIMIPAGPGLRLPGR